MYAPYIPIAAAAAAGNAAARKGGPSNGDRISCRLFISGSGFVIFGLALVSVTIFEQLNKIHVKTLIQIYSSCLL